MEGNKIIKKEKRKDVIEVNWVKDNKRVGKERELKCLHILKL